MSRLADRIAENLAALRQERPLIHHITNLVVMNDTANVTLHLGALPVMAHALEEVEEMTGAAGALVLNLGTLAPDWLRSMEAAARAANRTGVPVILDPVGAGATRLRTGTGLRLLSELEVAVVRGNAGEIGALSGTGGRVKGVESVESLESGDGFGDPIVQAATAAVTLARAHDTVVAVTGRRDIVSDGRRILGVDNGHPWLTALTGTGCMATTAVAAFAAVEPDPLVAAAGALAVYGLAAERAAADAKGPASFKTAFFDSLYHLQPEDAAGGIRLVELEPAAG